MSACFLTNSSRVTLAMIDAAAIELDALSPRMMGVTKMSGDGAGRGMASMTKCDGTEMFLSLQSAVIWWCAWRMPRMVA